MHDPARVLIAGMVLDAQWDAISVFLTSGHCANDEALSWFKAWRKRAEVLRTRRNDVVHSLWAIDGDDPEPSAVAIDTVSRKARAAPRLDVVPRRKDEVSEIANEILDLHAELAEWTAAQFRRLWPPASGS